MFLAFLGETNVATSITSLTVAKNVILRDIFNWFSNLRYIPAINNYSYFDNFIENGCKMTPRTVEIINNEILIFVSEAYLEPSRTSTMELFCENI